MEIHEQVDEVAVEYVGVLQGLFVLRLADLLVGEISHDLLC